LSLCFASNPSLDGRFAVALRHHLFPTIWYALAPGEEHKVRIRVGDYDFKEDKGLIPRTGQLSAD
jgi:hypothetical protein